MAWHLAGEASREGADLPGWLAARAHSASAKFSTIFPRLRTGASDHDRPPAPGLGTLECLALAGGGTRRA